jgi:hypothetical protein
MKKLLLLLLALACLLSVPLQAFAFGGDGVELPNVPIADEGTISAPAPASNGGDAVPLPDAPAPEEGGAAAQAEPVPAANPATAGVSVPAASTPKPVVTSAAATAKPSAAPAPAATATPAPEAASTPSATPEADAAGYNAPVSAHSFGVSGIAIPAGCLLLVGAVVLWRKKKT